MMLILMMELRECWPCFSTAWLLVFLFLLKLFSVIVRSQLPSPAHTQGREIGILYRRCVPFRSMCLFIQPFIYTGMDSYLFLLWVISQYYIVYFLAHLVPALATGGHWSAPLELPPLLFLSTSFLFVTVRCTRLISYFPCRRSRIIHFSEEPRFLL